MTDEAKALVALFAKFLGEWGKSRQYGEVIYGLHTGTEREVELTSTSIREARDLIETQAREIERLREALEREPKAWLIADEETAWVTLFEPNPKDHPWGDVIPLYSAALAGDSHDQ